MATLNHAAQVLATAAREEIVAAMETIHYSVSRRKPEGAITSWRDVRLDPERRNIRRHGAACCCWRVASRRVWIATTAKDEGNGSKALEVLALKHWPACRVLRVDSETIDDPNHDASRLAADPNGIPAAYDVVICTSAVAAGLSVDKLPGHFAAVLVIAGGTTDPEGEKRPGPNRPASLALAPGQGMDASSARGTSQATVASLPVAAAAPVVSAALLVER